MIEKIKHGLFILLMVIIPSVSTGASQESMLRADSLFYNNNTQAFTIYEELFEEAYASPSMLLKMAFIQDASDNYSEALYYLELYYQRSADRAVIGK